MSVVVQDFLYLSLLFSIDNNKKRRFEYLLGLKLLVAVISLTT